jgi:hypothetical protein
MKVTECCSKVGCGTAPKDTRRRLLRFVGIAALSLTAILALSGAAYAQSVSTDKADYAPGEIVQITGSGFSGSELVTLVVSYADLTPAGEGHDPWTVEASDGAFVTTWEVPYSDVGQTLLLTATGQTSELVATTTFTDHESSHLTITSIPASVVCGASFSVSVRLVQDCEDNPDAGLDGRTVKFFITSSCSGSYPPSPNATQTTSGGGYATVTLTAPTAGFKVRARYEGESKPSPCPTPGNSACDPYGSSSNRCVDISSSNDCEPVSVTCPPACVLTITCPPDKTIECDESTDPSNTGTATYTASTGCGTVTLSYTDVITPGACPQEETIARTWTATPTTGSPVTCVQTITVQDTEAPVFSGCPPDLVFQCASEVPACAFSGAGPIDNCDPSVTITCNRTSNGGTGCAASPLIYTDVFTATDDCGNSSQCSRTITVIDDTPPTITCPADFAVECLADIPACDPNAATASDNCGVVTVTCSDGPLVGGPCGGTVTRTFVATDPCGNTASCTQIITVDDNTPPTITCPPDFAVECFADILACDPDDATAADNCGTVTVTCSDGPLVGGPCGGTVTRTFVATDPCGNTASCDQIITVDDNTPPVITGCPGNLTFACVSEVPPCNVGGMGALDNCDGFLPVICSRTDNGGAGCPADPLIYTDVFTATDACGNSAQCQRIITVIDNVAPVLSGCPSNVTVECDAIPPPPTVTANDNCDGVLTPVLTVTTNLNGCGGYTGTITRKWTATDRCGNEKSCQQVLTIVDTKKPVITSCPPNIQVQGLENLPPCNTTGVVATDNCDASLDIQCSRSNLGGVGCGDGPIYVYYTYTATDDCGNVSDARVRTVTVVLPPCNFSVSVAGPVGTVDAVSGTQVSVPVKIDSLGGEIGRFDFAFTYDPAALSLLSVTKGEAIAEWEFFTYRLSSVGSAGLVRLTAIADKDKKAPFPSNPAFQPLGTVAYLKFQVSADQRLISSTVPVEQHLAQCADNTICNRTGDMTFVASDFDAGSCQSGLEGTIVPAITFSTGQIRIVEPILRRGDINLNGVACEVGDAVLLANYFINGNAVWMPSPLDQTQIQATDVNNDGVVATVGDLVTLIRVITGDLLTIPAYGKLSPYVNSVTVDYRAENGAVRVAATSPVDLGAVRLVFRYSNMAVGEPILSAAALGMSAKSNAQNGELRVLVHAWDASARVSAGTNEIVSIPTVGDGTIELVDVQISDTYGSMLSVSAAKSIVPNDFALLQNYPNPFNAGTVIPFNLPRVSDWSLAVYNIAGQVVRTFSGNDAVGQMQVAWDGTNNAGAPVASGVYFYHVKADTFTATRKMTLLK